MYPQDHNYWPTFNLFQCHSCSGDSPRAFPKRTHKMARNFAMLIQCHSCACDFNDDTRICTIKDLLANSTPEMIRNFAMLNEAPINNYFVLLSRLFAIQGVLHRRQCRWCPQKPIQTVHHMRLFKMERVTAQYLQTMGRQSICLHVTSAQATLTLSLQACTHLIARAFTLLNERTLIFEFMPCSTNYQSSVTVHMLFI
jgi:hypothetical protein